MNLRSGNRHLALLFGAAPLLAAIPTAPGDGHGTVGAPCVHPAEPVCTLRIVIQTGTHMLYVVEGPDTVFAAPVSTGMDAGFTYEGRVFHFSTPRGRRTVLSKSRDPVWTVPDWHYYEKAAERGLEPVHLRGDDDVQLSDGSRLVMREGQVGRINRLGYFAALPVGIEIIFDGRIYIPPLASPHRQVPGALGPFKLDLGGGYLIHGTNRFTANSIGQPVSHGCIRMSNSYLSRLYELVPVGTPVDIM